MPILPASNSHDSFFKQVFGQQENARSFLLSTLPKDVAQCLDLSILEPSPASFVDENLRQAHSDLLFRTQLTNGTETAVYLLFEHKSAADPLTVFQVLRYILKINEQRLRDQLELCCVIPVVVYHGTNPWNAAVSLRQLISVPPPLEPFVPDFSLQIMDLGQIQDSEFHGDAIFCATILVFKYIMSPQITDRLGDIFRMLRQAGQLQPSESVMLILNYLVSGSDRVPKDVLLQALQNGLSSHRETLMPTIAEQWVQEGHEAGIQAGIQAGLSRGQLLGSIRACQEFLGRVPDTIEQLDRQNNEQLADLERQLRLQLGFPERR